MPGLDLAFLLSQWEILKGMANAHFLGLERGYCLKNLLVSEHAGIGFLPL